MTLYTNFRGKQPDKTPMLKSRGLWKEPEEQENATADGVTLATDNTTTNQ